MAKQKRLPVQRQVSAGGVVYRRHNGKVEVLLCGRNKDGVWGLPKGTPNPGESLAEAAVREVGEETGLRVVIEREVGVIRYWFRLPQALAHKEVYHYLMAPLGGDLSQHDAEYDEVVWFLADEAYQTLTYPNEVEMARKAVALVEGKDGPGNTETGRP